MTSEPRAPNGEHHGPDASEVASLLEHASSPGQEEQEEPVTSGQALQTEQGSSPVKPPGEHVAKRRWSVWAVVLAATVLLVPSLLLALAAAAGWFRDKPPALHFFVIGDWGREGGQNQSAVASLMAAHASVRRPEFIISVGDNMYESGLTSPEDDQFRTSFSEVYSAPSLQVPWHAVLGNHDYGEHWDGGQRPEKCAANDSSCFYSPLHELHERLQERDTRWHCRRSFALPALGGRAQLFFIDTSPAIRAYYDAPWAANLGGLAEQSWEAQLLELEADLQRSTADWKLVIGHHPVLNAREPGNTPELVASLEPVLEAQGVQAYFCGHEHDLQLLRRPGGGVTHVISGAGSRSNYSDIEWDPDGSLFHHMGSGFVACSLDAAALECEFLGIASQAPLHSFRLERQ